MDLVTMPVGIVIIVLIVWEVFEDLSHPAHSGALSDWVGRCLFALLRRRRSLLPLAGPLTLVTVVGSWVLMLDQALNDFARHLGERFVDADPNDREAVFRAVARDHAVEVG